MSESADLFQTKYPCGVCNRNIASNHRSIWCSHCLSKIHIRCNKTDASTYEVLKSQKNQLCITCLDNCFPFQRLNKTQFQACVLKGLNKNIKENLKSQPSDNLKHFFTELDHGQKISKVDDDKNNLNCDYYDLSSFKFKNNKSKLAFFHMNIASLSKHKDELDTMLSMLDINFDIIGITETKIQKKKNPNFHIELEGFKCFSTPTESEKGGSLLYISNQLNTKPRYDLEKIMYKSKELESTFREIIQKNNKNLIVGCICRYPSMDLEDFNDIFDHLLEKISKDNKRVYLMGDFNIDLIKTDSEPQIARYFDSLTSNLFVPHISLPTRVTRHSKTLIDNIFSNIENFNESISGNLTLSISDHFAQFLIIPHQTIKNPKYHNLYKRDMKNFDKIKFIDNVSNFQWQQILQLDEKDPNISFESFLNSLNSLIDEYLPERRVTKKDLSTNKKPWISSDIMKMINKREHLFLKFTRAKDETIKQHYHDQHKALRNQIVSLSRESKKNYYQKFFSDNANNLRDTWKGIKEIIKIKEKQHFHPTSLYIDNKIINDPNSISNKFNEYFTSIAENLQKNIYNAGQGYHKYLKNKISNSFFIRPTNKDEILTTIESFQQGKSSGPNSIPDKILQLIKFEIAEPLSQIANISFETGIFIDKLKLAKVIPIYKNKESELNCENYRPIALLSNLNKIIEKLMYKRLYDFLDKYKCFYNRQFGFRSQHSTTHALISMTEDIRNALDNNLNITGVFLDFQKAFDVVDHSILLDKMNFYGIRGVANNWFKSYLSNRNQYVAINGVNSNVTHVPYGVPQGSILGPLLFLIFINDLHNSIKHSTVTHFADDTNLIIRNKSPLTLSKHLNKDLSLLSKWLKSNKISLNAKKTELMIFESKWRKNNFEYKIKIDGKKLIPSSYIKYLGLYIDKHLDWSFHSDIISSKLSRAVGMLAKLRHYVDNDQLRSVYFAIFSSLMTYGSIIWGQTQNSAVRRIENIQNKALRVINSAPFNSPTTNLYKNSKILKFYDHIKLQNFLFVHDDLHKNIPIALQNSFKLLSDNHNYSTRGSNLSQIMLPKIKKVTHGKYSIKFQAACYWNQTVAKYPSDNLKSKSRNFCKTFLRNSLLMSYDENIT